MTGADLDHRLTQIEATQRRIEFTLSVILKNVQIDEQAIADESYRKGYQVGRKQRRNGEPFDMESALMMRRKRKPHRALREAA